MNRGENPSFCIMKVLSDDGMDEQGEESEEKRGKERPQAGGRARERKYELLYWSVKKKKSSKGGSFHSTFSLGLALRAISPRAVSPRTIRFLPPCDLAALTLAREIRSFLLAPS